jgi:hypothetical protein
VPFPLIIQATGIADKHLMFNGLAIIRPQRADNCLRDPAHLSWQLKLLVCCVAGDFAQVTSSERLLKRQRNAEQPPCIPGGPELSIVDAASLSKMTPKKRIKTYVTPRKQRVALAAQPAAVASSNVSHPMVNASQAPPPALVDAAASTPLQEQASKQVPNGP